jgi:hypothetical protein
MKFRLVLACALSVALAGCATPLVRPNALTWQSKVEHAHDWQALADRTADDFASTLHAQPPKVFVAPGPVDMPFAAIYRKYLEQALMKRGYPVVETSWDAVVVNYDVQTFLYGKDNRKHLADYATLWTTAGAIGTGLRHISSVDTGLAVGLVGGPVYDFLSSMNDTTNAEVTVTTTVTDGTHIHYLNTEAIYVQPSDLPFYWTRLPPMPPQALPESALSTVSLPVRGDYR